MEFDELVHVISEAGVDFVIIGGVAAYLHGSARLTFDLDICYARSKSNLEKLSAALAPFHPRPRGFPVDLPFVWDAATLRNGTVFTLVTDLGEIDLLGEVAGLGTYDEVKAQSKPIAVYGRQVPTVTLRGLIAAKRAAGRKKDLDALPELEALLEATEQ